MRNSSCVSIIDPVREVNSLTNLASLESQLSETQALQRKLLEVLETHSDRDINSDGNIG